MPCWKEWHFPDEFDGFPQLKFLSIKKCPVLTGNLPRHLVTLEELIIERCQELACLLPRAPKLKEISISICHSLKLLPLVALQNLEKLQIETCLELECIEVSQVDDSDVLPSLRGLWVEDCPRLVSISTLVSGAPHLEQLTIRWCSKIDSFPEVGLPPSLTELDIYDCPKLTRWIISTGLQSEGLTILSLYGCDEVKSFPREGCLPTSLEYLKISKFEDLETLDCKALSHLTSLKRLNIWEYEKLKNMTEERLPPSITRLIIWPCPLRSKLIEMNHPLVNF